MTRIKVCGCCYDDAKGKHHRGLYIHNNRTNTFTIMNKRLEIVKGAHAIVTCESSIGNIILNL